MMKTRKYIALLTTVIFSLFNIISTSAAELQKPIQYGPGFFTNDLPGITADDIICNEHGYIVAVNDEALEREGISVESVGIFKLEESTISTEALVEVVETFSLAEPVSETVSLIPVNRWGITLSDYDREILAKIVDLEAGNQGDIGQQAVVEVVFNRVYSPLFPPTVIGVLSQRRQFTTWSFVHKGRPDARVYANIDVVLSGNSNILPYNTLYFSMRPFKGKQVQAKIQDHYFCNQ